MANLVAFLGVAVLVIVTPGQDTALTIRNTLLGRRPAGVATALGVATGQAVWAVATAAGIAALLATLAPAYAALKLAGAVYLIVLGLQAILAAVRARGPEAAAAGRGPGSRLTPAAAYRQGVLSNLANPKMAVFFISLLPQFTSGDGSFLALLGFGLAFCTLTLAWLTGYAVVVAKAGELLRRPSIRRTLDALLGAVLIALGLRLAAERP